MTEYWRNLKRFLILRILHADDTPRQIALGVAIGLFIAMTPTIGVQMVIALGLATLFRANKAASVAMVWVSNPLTAVYIYYQNWKIGQYFVQTSTINGDSAVTQHLQKIGDSIGGFSNTLSHLFDWAFWKQVLSLIGALGLELWVGSFIVAIITAIPGYFLSLWLITVYRNKFPRPNLFRRSKAKKDPSSVSMPGARPKFRKDSVL